MFKEGGCWRIDDGKNVHIWNDKWLQGGSLVIYRQDLVDHWNISLVSHLILQDNRGWNKPLLDMLFCPAIVQQIVSVPLPLFQVDDALFWPLVVHGGYTSKSGYRFIHSFKAEGASSSSHVVGLRPQLWKRFWNSDAIPRCKELSW